jgi:hypothetical protein
MKHDHDHDHGHHHPHPPRADTLQLEVEVIRVPPPERSHPLRYRRVLHGRGIELLDEEDRVLAVLFPGHRHGAEEDEQEMGPMPSFHDEEDEQGL